MADFTDLNSFFTTRISQYHKEVLQLNWQTNEFASLIPSEVYDIEEGLAPTIVRTTGQMPTAYPSAWTAIAVNDNSGSVELTPTLVASGRTTRTFALEGAAWQSDVFVLSDLQLSWNAARQAANFEQHLKEFNVVTQRDWAMYKSTGMIDYKYSCKAAGTPTSVSNTGAGVTGLNPLYAANLPTVRPDWDIMDAIYMDLITRGAGAFPIGMANGAPAFTLTGGQQLIKELFRDDEVVHEDVRWTNPQANFAPRGITSAVNGFIPNWQAFPMRLKVNDTTDGFEILYPFENTAATSGQKYQVQTAYKPVSQGGEAVYEVAFVHSNRVFEKHVRPAPPTQVAMQGYAPQMFDLDISWINNKDMDKNLRGDKGLYDWQAWWAAKPRYSEMGAVILFKIE